MSPRLRRLVVRGRDLDVGRTRTRRVSRIGFHVEADLFATGEFIEETVLDRRAVEEDISGAIVTGRRGDEAKTAVALKGLDCSSSHVSVSFVQFN